MPLIPTLLNVIFNFAKLIASRSRADCYLLNLVGLVNTVIVFDH